MYRNFKDYVVLEDLDIDARNFIENLSEEVRKRMRQKAAEGI